MPFSTCGDGGAQLRVIADECEPNPSPPRQRAPTSANVRRLGPYTHGAAALQALHSPAEEGRVNGVPESTASSPAGEPRDRAYGRRNARREHEREWDLNPNPLDEIGRYGLTWRIVDLLGFTREDLMVACGVYRSGTGWRPTVSGQFLPAGRISAGGLDVQKPAVWFAVIDGTETACRSAFARTRPTVRISRGGASPAALLVILFVGRT